MYSKTELFGLTTIIAALLACQQVKPAEQPSTYSDTTSELYGSSDVGKEYQEIITPNGEKGFAFDKCMG